MGRRYSINGIIKILKEYPFIEKMHFCQKNATSIMSSWKLDFIDKSNVVYPWELEIFVELSLFAEAPQTIKSVRADNGAEFIKIINAIRNYNHPSLKKKENIDFVNSLIMVMGLQQFKAQESILERLYRYSYFWGFCNDKINMPQTFLDNFNGIKYSEFRELAVLIYFYASLKSPTANIIRYLVLKSKPIVDYLKISRSDYKTKQSDKIDDNYENVIYGFNYLHPFPFIEFQEVYYLPLPYLIVDAVTDSLLTRVTYNNNSLREKIGKEVAQSYIESIFKETSIYEEVLPEKEYYVGKKKFDTPDVLIKKDDNFCLIDTKLSTPKLDVRNFNKQSIEKTILQYAKYTIQVYKRIKDFCDGFVYPFSKKVNINKNNVFGIVALLEDSYIMRRQIYDKVFSELNIDENSEEGNYVKAHIKITSFRDLELFAFRSLDIFMALKEKALNSKDWNDLGLYNSQLYINVAPRRLPSLDAFIKANQSIIMESIDELVCNGIINR